MLLQWFDNWRKQQRELFSFVIGNQGIVCTLTHGKTVRYRFFANTFESPEIEEISALMQTHPHTPVAVYLDHEEQRIDEVLLPPMVWFRMKKLVDQRLRRQFSEEIQGQSHPWIGGVRSRIDSKGQHYLYAYAEPTEPVSQWMAWIASHPNPVKGVYLWAIEMSSLGTHPAIQEGWNPTRTDDKSASTKISEDVWTIWAVQLKTSDLRILLMQHQQLVLSRTIRLEEEKFGSVIAGIIEQEIQSTIDYVTHHRQQTEPHQFRMLVVAAKDVVSNLKASSFTPHVLRSYNPKDFGELIQCEEAVTDKDRFSDTLCIAGMAPYQRKLALPVEWIRFWFYGYYGLMGMRIFLIAFPLWMIAWLLWNVPHNIQQYRERSELATKIEVDSGILQRLKKENDTKEASIRHAWNVLQVIQWIERPIPQPQSIIRTLMGLPKQPFLVQSFDWKIGNLSNIPPASAWMHASQMMPEVPIIDAAAEASILFQNSTQSLEDSFRNFSLMVDRMQQLFPEYTFNASKLTDSIRFDQQYQSMPATVYWRLIPKTTPKAKEAKP